MARCYYERLFIEPSCDLNSTGLLSLSRKHYFLKLKHFLEDSDSPKLPAVKRRIICEIDVENVDDIDNHETKRTKLDPIEIQESKGPKNGPFLEDLLFFSEDDENQVVEEYQLKSVEIKNENKKPEKNYSDSEKEDKGNIEAELEHVDIKEDIGREANHLKSGENQEKKRPEAVFSNPEGQENQENKQHGIVSFYPGEENQKNETPKLKIFKSLNNQDIKPVIRITSSKKKTVFKKRPLTDIANSNNTSLKSEYPVDKPASEGEPTENSNDIFDQINDQSLSDTDSDDYSSSNDTNMNVENTDSNSNSNDATCPNKFKCDQCEMQFNAKALLTKHMWKHATTKRHQCEECEYATNSFYHLKRHKLQHSDIKGFKCPECDYITMKLNELKIHQINQHPKGIIQEDGMFKCAFCEYDHKHYSKLVDHMGKHTGAFKFKCEKCNYSTNIKKHLERHISTHKSVYKCIDCPYTTAQGDDYKAHRRAHTIKGFSCDKCDFKTMRSDVMDTHKLDHLNLKLFNCDECEYGTNYSSHMRRHTAKHERDRLKPVKPPKPPKTPKTVKEKKNVKALLHTDKQEEVDELMEKIKAIDNLLNEDEKLP